MTNVERDISSNGIVISILMIQSLRHTSLCVCLVSFTCVDSVPDESGLTPLHIAAANGKTEVVNWLLSSDQDDPGIVTAAGYTPCHVAAINGHTDALMVGKPLTSVTLCDNYVTLIWLPH